LPAKRMPTRIALNLLKSSRIWPSTNARH
jgi:hypothetical protein